MSAAIVVAAVCAALAVGTASWQALRPLRSPARRLAPYTEVTRTRMGVPVESTPQPVMVAEAARRLLGPLAGSLVSWAGRMLRVADTASLEQRLRQAGNPMTVEDYRRRHLYWTLATPILGAVVGALLGSTVLAVVLFAAGAAGGGRRMGDQLRRLTRARAAQLRSDLPTVAGILSSRVENSNSLAVAVHSVVAMGSGPVIDDLGRAMVLKETGYSLAEAFEMVAAEAIDGSAARFYRFLATAAGGGLDLPTTLLDQARELRGQRREEIERAAARRQISMALPNVGLMLPVLLLFLVAPIPHLLFGS
jgi:tight adherence protein C